jgi:YVTN family beta-propeller protein
MRTAKLLFVPLVLALSMCAIAQTAGTTVPSIASSSSSPAIQPGVAAPVANPSPAPIVKPAPPSVRRSENPPPPNVNLQVPLPKPALLRRIAIIDIPGRPGFKDVAFINGCLVMAHPAAATVDIFSVLKRRVIAQIKGMKGASGIAVDAAGGRVFVANTDANEIAVISAKNWQVESRIPLHAAPDALLFVPQTETLYVSNWRDQSLSLVDAKQGSVLNTVVVGGRPKDLVYDPAAHQVFVSLEDVRQVVVVDPTLKIVKRYPLTASMPTGLALDAKARRLYVAVRSAVVELDADSGREIRRVAAPEGIDTLWLDEASGSLYGAAGNGTIALLKAGNGEAEREVSTEVRGHTLAYDPQQRMIYLPGGRDGRSKLLILRRITPGEAAPKPEVATK